MDPDAALAEIRQLVNKSVLFDRDVRRLQDLVDGLDDWLKKGGFLPADWTNEKRPG